MLSSFAGPSSKYQACNVVQLFLLVTNLSAICTILLFRNEMELTGIGGNTSMDVILLSELEMLPLREWQITASQGSIRLRITHHQTTEQTTFQPHLTYPRGLGQRSHGRGSCWPGRICSREATRLRRGGAPSSQREWESGESHKSRRRSRTDPSHL